MNEDEFIDFLETNKKPIIKTKSIKKEKVIDDTKLVNSAKKVKSIQKEKVTESSLISVREKTFKEPKILKKINDDKKKIHWL